MTIAYEVSIGYLAKDAEDGARLAEAAMNAVCSDGITTAEDHDCVVQMVGSYRPLPDEEQEEEDGG